MRYVKIELFITVLASVKDVEAKKPSNKQAIWRLECDLGVINDPKCPVDGGWGPWGAWSLCHGPCDDLGRQIRTRECVNPAPSQDGLPCIGAEEQTKSCYLTNCTVQDFRKLVEGDLVRLEAFRQLETVPVLMERCLQMECPFEAIEVTLATDNTWQIHPEALWNSLLCVKHNIGCPVIGEWGAWGAWSACGARCGKGLRWRIRRCDTPPPSASQLTCVGCPLQAEHCEGDQCAVDDPVNEAIGAWGEWGPWSPCSEKCGKGMKRRQRSCNEKHMSHPIGTWGTHCRGQHDQMEVCEHKICKLDGGWSGWGSWGPCSQSCGAGKRSRTRSCTRPMPAGGGSNCVGPRTEAGSCHLTPCEGFVHTVAVLNGESYLHYNFKNKRSILFHFYVRFLPLSPHGTLVRRGKSQSPHVRLSLQKWHICLDASGLSQSCDLPRLCSTTVVEPAVWHTALIAVTGEAATLRLDDHRISFRSTFSCDPDLQDDSMNIIVGEKFHGEIQELLLNFIPLNMTMERNPRSWDYNFYPSMVSNIAYEKANLEEAYVILDNDQYLLVPCFTDQKEWRLELTLKPKFDAGTIIFLLDHHSESCLHVLLQNSRLKTKLAIGDYRSESISSSECPTDQWLDIAVSKKREANTVEVSINAGEHLHVSLVDETLRKRRESYTSTQNFLDNVTKEYATLVSLYICDDEFYIGGVPKNIKSCFPEEFINLNAIIASLRINTILQDLHSFSAERYKDDRVQVSSKTASVSGSYHETFWGELNRLNLTCLHARSTRSPHSAHWLFLDTGMMKVFKGKNVRSVDDGRVLRLVASADNDLRGFYTCRAHSNKRTRNIVTYGVVGKIRYKLTGPDTTTAFAVITTLVLVASTLGWLLIECINDLRNGYGFFRDVQLTPEEEAELVCQYIDDNIDLYSNKSDAKKAKDRARRRGRQLASRANFAAQEPQGMMQQSNLDDQETNLSEPEELPALPEVTSSIVPSHDVFKCEPCYISSPRHGSNITSPRDKFTSSSSLEPSSPRLLCSRLLMARRIHSSKESLLSKKNKQFRNAASPRKIRSKLLTLNDPIHVNLSPAQMVLQKFHKLKSDDL